jgi:hypothetical protein
MLCEAVTALLFQMPRSRIRKNTRGVWSQVAVAHDIEEYTSSRMTLATAAKEFAVPRNTSARKAVEYSDDYNEA